MSQFDRSTGPAGIPPEAAAAAQARPNRAPAGKIRPREVGVAATMLSFFGGFGILIGLLFVGILNADADHGQSEPSFLYVVCFIAMFVSGLEIVSAVFVMRGKRWARVLAIWLCALNSLAAVGSMLNGGAFRSGAVALGNVALIVMLTRDEVTMWCD